MSKKVSVHYIGDNIPLYVSLAIKIGNNDDCPCGATRPREIITTVGRKVIGVPVKYKKCCKGKALFYRNATDKKLAEEDYKKRNPPTFKEAVLDTARNNLAMRISG